MSLDCCLIYWGHVLCLAMHAGHALLHSDWLLGCPRMTQNAQMTNTEVTDAKKTDAKVTNAQMRGK